MMDGLVIINKEPGITSFQAVNKTKRLLHAKKAGHTGTLDPMATGVLPVLLGSYTKFADLIAEGEKEYIAHGRFGLMTDTLDITGQVTRQVDVKETNIPEETLKTVLASFMGDIDQIPPMYSALKKDGKRLYELARAGVEIEREARPVTIYELELLQYAFPDFKIRCRCSKGTYIRSLIRDIGDAVEVPAVMTGLVRTLSGGFTLADALDLNNIGSEDPTSRIIKAEVLFKDYPMAVLDEAFITLLKNGVKLRDARVTGTIETDGLLRIFDRNGSFVGLAEFNGGELNLKYKV